VIENDDLTLAGLNYFSTDTVTFPDVELALPGSTEDPGYALMAMFFSRQKQAVARILFRELRAFRILDEGGLVDLWHASQKIGRPGKTTFKVRGHGWQTESELEWLMGAPPDQYSYVVATNWQCLEVVCFEPPYIELEAAVVRKPQ
jgi:hypothetical protein